MAWVPERQRREARPTAVLAFLFALLLWPMATCGTIGSIKLRAARAPIVSVTSPEQLEPGAGLEPGTYVAVDVSSPPPELTVDTFDPSPWDGFPIRGAPHVLLVTKARVGSSTMHVVGRLCDAGSLFVCELPEARMAPGLRRYSRYVGGPVVALVDGARPAAMRWEAAMGLGVAASCLAVFVLTAIFLLRAARRPGLVVLTRTVTLAQAPAQIRAALRAQAGPLCRVAEDAPERMCLLLGKPVATVRLLGTRTPETIPLRVDVELEAADAYRGTTATLTVRELTPSPVKLPARLAERTHLARERAIAWALGTVRG